MHEPPYYRDYSSARLLVHSVVTSKYFDLAIAAVIGLNVVTMALEFYMMPKVSVNPMALRRAPLTFYLMDKFKEIYITTDDMSVLYEYNCITEIRVTRCKINIRLLFFFSFAFKKYNIFDIPH